MNFSEISLINAIFVNITLFVAIFGGLTKSLEPHMPVFIIQLIRYGKYKFSGRPNKFLSRIEMQKAKFCHFYAFAAIFSLAMCWLTVNLYLFDVKVPEWFIIILDITCGSKRQVKTAAFPTLVALILMTLQCLKRCYETYFIQVFSKASTVTGIFYVFGYVYYIGILLIILSHGDGFVRDSSGTPLDKSLNLVQFLYCAPCIVLFIVAWLNQFQSNVILANLRKNKTGQIISETYKIPVGGYFEEVSSPHMLFEILMYISITGIIYQNTSWLYVVVWVLYNQTLNAVMTHRWYKEKFPEYSKSRKAIFPRLL